MCNPPGTSFNSKCLYANLVYCHSEMVLKTAQSIYNNARLAVTFPRQSDKLGRRQSKNHVDFSAARDDGTGDDDKRDSKPREKLRRHQHTNQHLVYFADVLLWSTNSVKALQANRWKDTALYRRLISVEGNKRCQQLINTVY